MRGKRAEAIYRRIKMDPKTKVALIDVAETLREIAAVFLDRANGGEGPDESGLRAWAQTAQQRALVVARLAEKGVL